MGKQIIVHHSMNEKGKINANANNNHIHVLLKSIKRVLPDIWGEGRKKFKKTKKPISPRK